MPGSCRRQKHWLLSALTMSSDLCLLSLCLLPSSSTPGRSQGPSSFPSSASPHYTNTATTHHHRYCCYHQHYPSQTAIRSFIIHPNRIKPSWRIGGGTVVVVVTTIQDVPLCHHQTEPVYTKSPSTTMASAVTPPHIAIQIEEDAAELSTSATTHPLYPPQA